MKKKSQLDLLEYTNKRVGIISFSSEKSNLLLWSHYANAHHGFAVGFDSKFLIHSIGDLRYECYLVAVNYMDEYPIYEYTEDYRKNVPDYVMYFKYTIAALTSKSSCWSYENEIRILLLKKFNTPINFPAEAVKEILIGFQVDNKSKTEIIEACALNFPISQPQQCAKLYASLNQQYG